MRTEMEDGELGVSTITWWQGVLGAYGGEMQGTKPLYKGFRELL